MFYLDVFFFFFVLDSFPGDPHLAYVMPTGEMELRSPWADRGSWGLERALPGGVEGLDTPRRSQAEQINICR